MPTYTYSCKNEYCEEFDRPKTVKKKMTDPSPVCSCNQSMQQVFNKPSPIKLKGSGWTGSSVAKIV